MKKRITVMLAVTMLMAIAFPVTASAASGTTSYSVCTVENCNTTGVHKHGGAYYAGHYLNDGHEHHGVCPVQGCTRTVAHNHNGTTYFGHHNGDGHTYHSNSRHNGGHRSRGRHH